MQHRRKRPLSVLPVSRLFPNMVTLAGLCCGLSSIRFALDAKFETAVALLVAAAILDGMDGRIARLLNSASTFGAQLDSLCDFVCFGVSPGIVLYMWKLHEIRGLGWSLVLFFAVCCALRLARFNTHLLSEEDEPWRKKFFTGIPSPAAAMLALMPLVVCFYDTDGTCDNTRLCAVWIALIAVLMTSRIPTFAAKRLHVRHEWVLPIMLICTLVMVLVVIEPWIMLSVCGIVYCLTIPLSMIAYRKAERAHRQAALSHGEASSQ